jgi:uncharacterized membrane protein
MWQISDLEQDTRLDGVVSAGQRVARFIRPGKVRDVLHGVWLGHPLHPMLIQATIGTWLSASILDFAGGDQRAARRLVTAGLAVAAPAALAGAADWSEQHEQQMRVGVVHAAGTIAAAALYGTSLIARGPRAGRLLRLAGLAAVSASGLLGGHLSFRLAGGRESRGRGRASGEARLAAPDGGGRPARGQGSTPDARRGPGRGRPAQGRGARAG